MQPMDQNIRNKFLELLSNDAAEQSLLSNELKGAMGLGNHAFGDGFQQRILDSIMLNKEVQTRKALQYITTAFLRIAAIAILLLGIWAVSYRNEIKQLDFNALMGIGDTETIVSTPEVNKIFGI